MIAALQDIVQVAANITAAAARFYKRATLTDAILRLLVFAFNAAQPNQIIVAFMLRNIGEPKLLT